MKRIVISSLILIILISLFSSIQVQHNKTYQAPGHFWQPNSLRGIDLIDSIPEAEIIAYYIRETPTYLELRIDLLTLDELNNYVL